jgi:hypothetical protein
VPAQQGAQHQAEVLFIIDDQDAAHCEKNATRSLAAPQPMT